MDGANSQTDIHQKTGMHRGHLSTLVKQFAKSGLLAGEIKYPRLAISIPMNFFDKA
jgi:hypothetical protein